MTSTTGRKRKKNGFSQIANSMFEDERLSWRAKGLLGYMLSRPDEWKINKTDLYNRAVEGRDAVQNALNELKDLGYLHIFAKKVDNGKIEAWVWEYSDEPIHNTEKPDDGETTENIAFFEENHNTENPASGKPSVWNPSIYNNTDFNNTDYNNTDNKNNNNKNTCAITPELDRGETGYTKNGTPSKKPSSPQIEKEFEQLWAIYPRKIGKKKAFDSFKKARKIKNVPYETIENGLYRYISYLQQQETDEQFILHGSTFFNSEKWQDEYVTTGINKKPKDALEYFRMKHGGELNEPNRNRKIINNRPEVLSDLF